MKNRRFANSLIVMVFAIVALAMVGCNDINGGGWIKKSNGKKANFGFNFKCKSDDTGNAKVSGQLQFNDHETGVKFHGVADSVPLDTCGGSSAEWAGQYSGSYIPESAGQYSGSYTPRGRKSSTPELRKLSKGEEQGRFEIYLEDRGESGPSKGDYFRLTLEGGIYDGYSLEGTLEGGNIQVPGA
jgi:ribosomal protein L27